MTRNEIHAMIDQLTDSELSVVGRMLEGLQATRVVPAGAVELMATSELPASDTRRPPSPIRPVGTPIRPKGHDPLANHQFSQLMSQEENPENQNMLRKVMFARVSDLISWVNRD